MNYGEVIALANDQDLVIYKTFGSYSGDWIAITKDSSKHYIYKGYYGSCSGCDSLEDFTYNRENDYADFVWTKEIAKKFIGDEYRPFSEVDSETFHHLLKSGNLKSIMPANTRLNFSDDDYEEMTDDSVWEDLSRAIKDLE